MFGVRWLIFLLNLVFITAACTFMLSNSWAYDYADENSKPQWLYRDTLELFFYIAVMHHNAGLLFQYVIVVNMVLLAVAMTFIVLVVQESSITGEAIVMIPFFIFANVVSAYFKVSVQRENVVDGVRRK